jgi:hypothetical protein
MPIFVSQGSCAYARGLSEADAERGGEDEDPALGELPRCCLLRTQNVGAPDGRRATGVAGPGLVPRKGNLERETGFEPATFCLGSRHSAS